MATSRSFGYCGVGGGGGWWYGKGAVVVLLHKQWLSLTRRWQTTALLLFSPILFLLALYLLQHLNNNNNNNNNNSSPISSASSSLLAVPFLELPTCPRAGGGAGVCCHVLLLSPNDSSVVREVATQLALKNSPPLTMINNNNNNNNTQEEEGDIAFLSSEDMTAFVLQNPGCVYATISFPNLNKNNNNHSSSSNTSSSPPLLDLTYVLSVNTSALLLPPSGSNTNSASGSEILSMHSDIYPSSHEDSSSYGPETFWWGNEDSVATAALAVSLEAALLSVMSNGSWELDLTSFFRVGDFPSPSSNPGGSNNGGSSNEKDEIVASLGGLWFFCPPMLNMILFTNLLVGEKEGRVREGMSLMGLQDGSYWASWLVGFAAITLLHSFVFQVFGGQLFFGFRFVTNTNWFLGLSAYFLFSYSLVPVACLLSTLLSSTTTANTVSFLLFVIGFFIQVLFTGFDLYDWFAPSASATVRSLFALYPPFNFVKYYTDVNTVLNNIQMHQSDPYFSWEQLVETVNVTSNSGEGGGRWFAAPEPIGSFYHFLMNILIFTGLFLYLDKVMEAPHHIPLHPLFFLNPRFYFEGETPRGGEKLECTNDSASAVNTEAPVLTLTSLSKDYNNNNNSSMLASFCCRKDKKKGENTLALESLDLGVKSGEVFCLLGQNGAGKTTCIRLLTGLLSPSSGDATIFGYSLKHQMAQIRRVIGYCPQFDILFDEMTAAEHLWLFGVLKGLEMKRLRGEVMEKLEQVNLLEAEEKGQRVGSFSGGMKRRLSVAISSLGSPRVIFMDEPTTGMDPTSRREVWRLLLQTTKRDGTALLLTTHSMDEAEVLSDRIGVLSHGRLVAIGDSLSLKALHGSGYLLHLHLFPASPSSSSSSSAEEMEERRSHILSMVASLLPRAQKVMDTHLHFSGGGGGGEKNVEEILSFEIPESDSFLIREFLLQVTPSSSSSSSSPSWLPISFIRDWSLHHTSMENVFLHLTSKTKTKTNNKENP